MQEILNNWVREFNTIIKMRNLENKMRTSYKNKIKMQWMKISKCNKRKWKKRKKEFFFNILFIYLFIYIFINFFIFLFFYSREEEEER